MRGRTGGRRPLRGRQGIHEPRIRCEQNTVRREVNRCHRLSSVRARGEGAACALFSYASVVYGGLSPSLRVALWNNLDK